MTPTRRDFLRQSAGALVGATVASALPLRSEEEPKEAITKNMETIQLPAHYYQHFDADYDLEVPAEGYAGWKEADLEISPDHTAVVVMHAWDCGTLEEYPGWFRAVEYIPRATEISRTIFPGLLSAMRASDLPLFHVVGGGEYYKDYPGYKHAVELSGPAPPSPEQVESDPVLDKLQGFRSDHVFVGPHNRADVERGFQKLDFLPEAKPQGNEGVAENGHQLFALCREAGVNHLIYAGFAINWCLLLSPGGMHEMSQRGVMCSALRQAVTAVENKESARHELCKEIGLWRVALAFGFVFDVDDFVAAL